jgi:alpha-L-fucosidase
MTNGEAVYGSRPWEIFGEGPTEPANGSFSESKGKPYTARDFRFTTKGGALYAIQMAEPDGAKAVIVSLKPERKVKSVHLLGIEAPLGFEQTGAGLAITPPERAPRQPASVYRIDI